MVRKTFTSRITWVVFLFEVPVALRHHEQQQHACDKWEPLDLNHQKVHAAKQNELETPTYLYLC